jgi:asparagine N-glycosylation enzyme membrane subunit Stt3
MTPGARTATNDAAEGPVGPGPRIGSRLPGGAGTLLVAIYALFALSASARSLVQVLRDFESAPLAYSLSVLAALTYIAAAVLLSRPGRFGTLPPLILVIGELVGVAAVGTLSLVRPDLFPDETVWSGYGAGYAFVPLLLPVAALVWLLRRRRRDR